MFSVLLTAQFSNALSNCSRILSCIRFSQAPDCTDYSTLIPTCKVGLFLTHSIKKATFDLTNEIKRAIIIIETG